MGGRVLAVLGPTNTGKTHFAIERMLGHASGMIGFPLRLLARENYDRIVRAKGAAQVALITGEEKIIPAHPRWFVCTVESMPLDRRVAFLAIDEIQLCADPERGHIFTDRLLHARGMEETVFLGADTIKSLVRKLVPGVEITSRPRLSRLTYAGARKLNRLPTRSAVVAFSAGDVYALAEYIRRQKGGAAVVLGALSPRTRNAQVGLYQAGEVDFIVATDAIGMGLNMDVDHVAFAGLSKFDGRGPRALTAPEIAQIAGRAGRHMNDGTFGTTADIPGIDEDTVEAVENHAFPALTALSWRNSALTFTSIAALQASLERRPDQPVLIRARDADDQRALAILAGDADIAALANHPERVKLLWDVCQIPDFRKVMAESHTRLLGRIFHHLCGPGRRLPADWLAGQLTRLDRTDGEMETLLGRIAHVRTWTYVSHRADWVTDPAHWQETSRAIEDRLSDALHASLTQRFVDRRTSVLVRAMQTESSLAGAVGKGGEVLVEGQFVGRLDGFRFVADQADGALAAKAVLGAATRSLKPEIAARLGQLDQAVDSDLMLGDDGVIRWHDQPVGRLTAGPDLLRPAVEPLAGDMLEPGQRDRLRRRLERFVADTVTPLFGPFRSAPGGDISGPARGLLHQLSEGLGSLPAHDARGQIAALSSTDRQMLARLGVRLGLESVFVPALLKPAAQRLRGLLWAAATGQAPPPPTGGRVVLSDTSISVAAAEAQGYRAIGGRLVRVDVLERFAAEARRLERDHPEGFTPPPALAGMLGVKADAMAAVLTGLGWRQTDGKWRRHKPKGPRPKRRSATETDSPFAVLRRRPNA